MEQFAPEAMVVDPISNLAAVGRQFEVKSMLTRVIDHLKNRQVTAVFTSLTGGDQAAEQTEVGISSLMDAWVVLRMVEQGGEHVRLVQVLKSRGMAHSNRAREFSLSERGIELGDADAPARRRPRRSPQDR